MYTILSTHSKFSSDEIYRYTINLFIIYDTLLATKFKEELVFWTGDHPFSTYKKIPKGKHFVPTRTCAYQRVGNASF